MDTEYCSYVNDRIQYNPIQYNTIHISMNKLIGTKCINRLTISFELRRKCDEVTHIMSGHVGCTETSVRNYNYTLCYVTEDRRSEGDTITMVTLKLQSSEIFPFQKGMCQGPNISMQSLCPFAPYISMQSVRPFAPYIFMRSVCPLAP